MITAVELTFSPMEAMRIAQAKIHRLDPRKEILLIISSITFSFFSSPWCRLKRSLKKLITNYYLIRFSNIFSISGSEGRGALALMIFPSLSRSIKTGISVMPYSRTNWESKLLSDNNCTPLSSFSLIVLSQASRFSSTEILTNSIFLPLNLFCNSFKTGISPIQGRHQVAHTST